MRSDCRLGIADCGLKMRRVSAVSSLRIPHSALRNSCRHGSTLLELAVSVLVASILVVGMGSSVYLAARASDPTLGRYQASAASGEALADISRELSCAVALNDTVNTPTQVEFTVPDITGDNLNDVVRYAWSGTGGAALQRTLNGGAPRSVVDNVHAFQLAYQKRAREGTSTTESAEVQWVNQFGVGSTGTYDVESGINGIGIWFAPSLPAGTTAWRIKRIEIKARQVGTADGAFRAQVHLADSGHLPLVLREQVIVSESNLPTSSGGYEIAFPGVASFLPTERACITFVHDSGSGTVARLEYGSSSTGSANTSLLAYETVLLLFQTWVEYTSADLRIRIWGNYSGPPGTGTQEFYYTNVDSRLQIGTNANATFHQGVRLVNVPQAAGP